MKKALLIAPMSSVHERFNLANFNALEANGFKVSVIANFSLCEHDKQYKSELENKGIEVFDVPFVRASLLKNLRTVPLLKEILKNNDYAIIHSHTETGGILTRLAMSSNKKAKYFFTPHGMSFYKGSSLKSQLIYYPIEKWICNKMDKVLCINKEEFETVQKWKKGNEAFVHGIGLNLNAVTNAPDKNCEIREEFGISKDEKIVLSVGELNDNKNHAICIKALGTLEEEVSYVICGEGEKREELLELAKENGIKLILTGYRYDVKSFYRLAKLFVFPSFHEGLAVSLLEAMAAGLPVVCSRIRGNVDVIVNNEGGFLCEAASVSEFAKAIKLYLTDDEKSAASGAINKSKSEHYSLVRVTEELKKIYK